MRKVHDTNLAKLCRAQASLANCPEARSVLLDLASIYESGEDSDGLAEGLEDAPPQELERLGDPPA